MRLVGRVPSGYVLPLLLAVAACADDLPPTLPLVAQAPPLSNCQLPQDSVRYYIMVDHSGSMIPFWPTVRKQLEAIVPALPADATFRLDLFSGTVAVPSPVDDVRLPMSGLGAMTGKLPAPLRQAPTDIGRAVDGILDAVEHERRAINFVFVVSDGKHQPPTGSRFAQQGNAAWQALGQRCRAVQLADGGSLFLLVIPIGGQGLAGAAAVQDLCPFAIATDSISEHQLTQTISKYLQLFSKEQLARRVEDEVRYVRLSAAPENQPAPIAFPRSRHSIGVASAANCVSYLLTRGTDQFLVPPGGTVTLPLSLSGRWAPRMLWPRSRWNTTAAPDTLGRMHTAAGFHPAAEIASLNVIADSVSVSTAIVGYASFGPVSWTLFGTAAGSLVLLIGVLIWLRLPPRPVSVTPTEPLRSKHRGVATVRDGMVALGDQAATPRPLQVVRASWRSREPILRVGDGADSDGTAISRLVAYQTDGNGMLQLVTAPSDILIDGTNLYIVWAEQDGSWPQTMRQGELHNSHVGILFQ
jgi:hypothetical protein